jgi:hypothetical protein
MCAEIKLRAERRAGELLKEMPRESGMPLDKLFISGLSILQFPLLWGVIDAVNPHG